MHLRRDQLVVSHRRVQLMLSHRRQVQEWVHTKGYYLIEVKAYGYQGGDFELKVTAEEATGAPAKRVKNNNTDAGGTISYGQTKFGDVKASGEMHKYTFNGTKDHVVIVSAGPDWAPNSSAEMGIHCGKGFGQGKDCIDTQVCLTTPGASHAVSPSRRPACATQPTQPLRASSIAESTRLAPFTP